MITNIQLKQIIKEIIRQQLLSQYYKAVNVVNGTQFNGRFPVYKKFGIPYAKILRRIRISGIVIDSLNYDNSKRHWITFKVLTSTDQSIYKINNQYTIAARDFYDSIKQYKNPIDYLQQAAQKERLKRQRNI